jgi:uncharacterized membrane protein
MQRLRFACSVIIPLVSLACEHPTPSEPSAVATRGQPSFTITTIDVPSALSTGAQGINAEGVISGTYRDANGFHGFILRNGVFDTVDYPDADNTELRGIGPDGAVLGDHWNNDEEATAAHGFRRTAGGQFVTVHFPGHLYEFPQRILADGTILGCRHDHDLMASMRGVRTGRDGSTEIEEFASMNNGATPAGRRIVGLYTNMMAANRTEAYIIDDGVLTPFLVPGSSLTTAWDVNPRGDVVGVYRDASGVHGYVMTTEGITTIDVPGASATRAFGINAHGDVIGTYVTGGVTHSFLAARTR